MKIQQGHYSMENFLELFESTKIEPTTKYLFLILMELQIGKYLEISIKQLCKFTGLTKDQVYRARTKLKKLGLLNHQIVYCAQSGLKIKEIYCLNK